MGIFSEFSSFCVGVPLPRARHAGPERVLQAAKGFAVMYKRMVVDISRLFALFYRLFRMVGSQARKRHININFFVRLVLWRPRVCPGDFTGFVPGTNPVKTWGKPGFSPCFTQWKPDFTAWRTLCLTGECHRTSQPPPPNNPQPNNPQPNPSPTLLQLLSNPPSQSPLPKTK